MNSNLDPSQERLTATEKEFERAIRPSDFSNFFGQEQVIDTSSSAVRNAQARWWKQQSERLKDTFSRSQVDAVSVRTDQDYVSVLRGLFANRK